jgi:hypothetical protein
MEKKVFKYIEIRRYDDDSNVLRRIDVSDKSDRSIEKLEDAYNINLNHEKLYTTSFESENELKIIPAK